MNILYNIFVYTLSLVFVSVILAAVVFALRLIFNRRNRKNKGYLFLSSLIYTSIFVFTRFILAAIVGLILPEGVAFLIDIVFLVISGVVSYKLTPALLNEIYEPTKENSNQTKNGIPQWVIDECEERKNNLVAIKDRLQELVKEKEISQATATALYESYCDKKDKA